MAAGRNKNAGFWAIMLSIGVHVTCTCSTPLLYGNDDAPAAQPDPAAELARIARLAGNAKFAGIKAVFIIDGTQIGWVQVRKHIGLEEIDIDTDAGSNQIRIDDETLDRLFFHSNSKIQAASDILRIDSRARISAIDRVCGLTPAQGRKLSLAARGDVRRFLEKRDELRKKYQERPIESGDIQAQFVVVGDLCREIEELCRTAENTTSRDDTIFVKTMQTCLTADQKAMLEPSAKVGPAVPVSRSGRFTHTVGIKRVFE